MTLPNRSRNAARIDRAADDAVHRRRRGRPREPRQPGATGSSPAAPTGSRSAARPASRAPRRSPSGSRRSTPSSRPPSDRVPVVPGTGTRQARRDHRAHRRRLRGGRRCRAHHHAVLRPPHPGGAVRLVPHGRRGVPRPADPRLQRAQSARPSTSRPRPSRGCYRDVENFVGVKETTKDFEHFSPRHPALRPRPRGLVGHRAAVPAAARAGRRRIPQRDGEHRARRARRMFELWEAGDLDRRPRDPLRPAPARRPAVRRDQPGAGQVGARAARADPLGLRAAAADHADRGRAGQDRARYLAQGEAYLTPADGFQIGAAAMTATAAPRSRGAAHQHPALHRRRTSSTASAARPSTCSTR